MKTSKSETRKKSQKKVDKPAKNKKVNLLNSRLSEDEIREKANEIYHQRTERGEYGTAENDWIEAEKYLKNI